MTSYVAMRRWLDSLNVRAFASIVFAVVCLLATAVFGILPHGSLLVVNAFLSGAVWAMCLLVLVVGGKRVDLMSSTGAALIAGGLTTSIPSIFYEHTPVDWGSTLSRLGLLIIMLRWGYEILKRWKDETSGERD